jgi:hypothetical protein
MAMIIMKHDKHGHCFAYNPNEVNNLKSLGWYEKPKPIIQETIQEEQPPQAKKIVKNRRK